MKDADTALKVIKNIIADNSQRQDFYSVLVENLIQTKKMTGAEVSSVLSSPECVEKLSTHALVWIYQTIAKYIDVPDIKKYFYQNEIDDANFYKEKEMNSTFPLSFSIIDQLSSKDEYLICLSIQEINELNRNVIRLVPDMQRESVVSIFKDKIVSHINFSDKRAREIGKSIADNSYWSNMIRWNLVANGEEEYLIQDGKITIFSGILANIDGQHRSVGLDYALTINPDIDRKLPIVLTIGTTKDAQTIINQEEKREPIAKSQIQAFANTVENQVVKNLKKNEDIADIYKFIRTIEQYDAGLGFVIEASLARAIEGTYQLNTNATLKQRRQIEKWIIDFLFEIDDIFHDEFKNFGSKKSWASHPYAFYGYIYLSGQLMDCSDWESTLRKTLGKIDFHTIPWHRVAKERRIEKQIMTIFQEAYNGK